MAIKASVIIPAYNCCQLLEKSLEAILDQTVESMYEVIVVDDGSTDETCRMMEKFRHENLLYLRQEHRGRSKARNTGIQSASGEVIIFIDSDILVSGSFVESHLKAHAGGGNVIVRGRVVNIPGVQKPHHPKLLSGFSAASFPTCNCSVRKDSLIKAGLFDEEFTQYGWEDLELGHRLLNLGIKKVKAWQAVGFHVKPPLSYQSLAGQVRKEYERGRMAVLYCQKSPTTKTRISTMYTPPLLIMESIVNIMRWPDHPRTDSLLKWLDSRGLTGIFRFIAGFKLLSAYFRGMREAGRQNRQSEKTV